MSDKNFKVKSGLQVPSLTTAGPVSTDASGNVTSNAALPVNQGGTGQTTAGNALNALLPLQTGQDNKFFQTNGVSTQWTTPQQQTSTDGTLGYKVYSGTVTPSSPVTGDIWIDQTTGNGIQLVRWRKTVASTTTTVTGLDDNNLTLSYTAGNEQVYINGTLITRGQDYTATNGTSVVLVQAAEIGDTVEIFGNPLFSVTDVYTQAQSNSLYVTNSNYPVAGKNKIINGDFAIWQRGTSSFSGTYTADRWWADVYSVVSRSTDVPSGQPFTYSLKHTSITLNSALRHAIELPEVGQLGVYKDGTTWTLSFWTKTTAARVVRFYAAFTIGNQGTVEATPVGNVALGTSAVNTWQKWSYTFTIPNGTSLTSSNCFQIVPFIEGNGVALDTFITGIQLEQGSIATSFSTATGTMDGELAACQRYYERITGSPYTPMGVGQCGSTTAARISVPFRVTKRVAPAFASSALSGLNVWGASFAGLTPTALYPLAGGKDICILTAEVASGLVAGNATQLLANNSTSAYIEFSAEL